ncbi:hypothetical protein ACFLXY_10570 [Chloroflexota bacterium]
MQDKENNRRVMEWWKNDRMDSIWWGLSFIWGALILLAGIINFGDGSSWWNGWGVFFTGLGIITLIGIIIRLLLPMYRRKLVSGLIWGILFLAIGLGTWGNTEWFWVAAIFVVGISILGVAFVRSGKNQISKVTLSSRDDATGQEPAGKKLNEVKRRCQMTFCPMIENCPMTFCPVNKVVE